VAGKVRKDTRTWSRKAEREGQASRLATRIRGRGKVTAGEEKGGCLRIGRAAKAQQGVPDRGLYYSLV